VLSGQSIGILQLSGGCLWEGGGTSHVATHLAVVAWISDNLLKDPLLTKSANTIVAIMLGVFGVGSGMLPGVWACPVLAETPASVPGRPKR